MLNFRFFNWTTDPFLFTLHKKSGTMKLHHLPLSVLKGVFLLGVFLTACQQKPMDSSEDAKVTAEQEKGRSEIEFIEKEHNFGKLSEGEVVSYTFRFKNAGTGSLVIKSTSASCGCTVPKYDKEPIPPEGTGSLEVVFNTMGKLGQQHKTIGVRTNGQPNFILLNIYAEVLNEKEKM